ncbi:Uncharacterised protein [uncultured archaeon]|nr:Uncharacterised protein [uncultured archaeon]
MDSRIPVVLILIAIILISGCVQGPSGGQPPGGMETDNKYGFLPPKTCPDGTASENGRAIAIVNGSKKYVTKEDGDWIGQNCNQGTIGMNGGLGTPPAADESNFSHGYGFFPSNICPEKLVPENNLLLGMINGTKRFIRWEDEKWIKANCDQKLWDMGRAENQEKSTEETGLDFLPQCGTDNAFFSNIPVSLTDVTGIVPLGNFNPSGHTFPTDHVYFYLRKPNPGDYSSAPVQTALSSPGNAWVIAISVSEHASENPPYTDYGIDISPCKDVKIRFGHVTSLSQKLKDAIVPPYSEYSEYSTGGKNYKMYRKILNVSVNAGESIGTAGGRAGQNALDVGTYDNRVNLSFANPARWQQGESQHTACPLDYFTPDTKSKMEAMLGDYYGTVHRTIQPICGEFAQDVPATAQSAWFVKGTTNTYPEDLHLTLAHDNVDPKKGEFSVGTSIKGISTGVYSFSPTNTGFVNRDFKGITSDGKVYCYEPGNQFSGSSSFTIILQLTSENTLRIEKKDSGSCGSGPWVFGSGYADFER